MNSKSEASHLTSDLIALKNFNVLPLMLRMRTCHQFDKSSQDHEKQNIITFRPKQVWQKAQLAKPLICFPAKARGQVSDSSAHNEHEYRHGEVGRYARADREEVW